MATMKMSKESARYLIDSLFRVYANEKGYLPIEFFNENEKTIRVAIHALNLRCMYRGPRKSNKLTNNARSSGHPSLTM